MKFTIFRFAFLALTAIVLQGCITPITGNTTSAPLTSEIAPEEFANRIKKLLEELPTSQTVISQGVVRSTHLELARLYMSPRNPNRDTVQATSELETYLKMNPEGVDRLDAENLLAVLKEINGLKAIIADQQLELRKTKSVSDTEKKAHSRIKELEGENALLKERQKELLADNKKLETTIEKLKFLDLNLEKKRKTFR